MKLVQPCAWTWVAQTGWDLPHRHFLQCLSFVPGWGQQLVELLPGLLQPSAVVPVTWKVLGVHIPLWKETYGCALSVPGGGDGRVGKGITAIWIEDLLSSHPCHFLLFL